MNRRSFLKALVVGILGFLLGIDKLFAFPRRKPKVVGIYEEGNTYRIIFSDGSYMRTNEVGLLTYYYMSQGYTEKAVARRLAQIYGHPFEQVYYDVINFANNLRVIGVI